MKKIIGILLMGVACSSFASMAPTEAFDVKKPSVTQMDASKRKIIRKEIQPTSEKVSDETMASLKRYEGILTMDNVRTVENMSALMQNNPAKLMKQLSVKDMNFEIDQHAMGSNDLVKEYVRAPETDDPAERFSNVQVPALTGSYSSVRSTQAELKEAHAKALKQIEEIAHQNLGQKSAPVGMLTSVEDIKALNVDESLLPDDWEEQLKKSQDAYQAYKQKQANQQKTGQSSSAVEVAGQQAVATMQGQQATSAQATAASQAAIKTTQSASKAAQSTSKATQSAAKKSASTAKSAQTQRRSTQTRKR